MFDPDELAAKIDWEGGIEGGAMGYFGPTGPADAPADIKEAWEKAHDAVAELCVILETHGALL